MAIRHINRTDALLNQLYHVIVNTGDQIVDTAVETAERVLRLREKGLASAEEFDTWRRARFEELYDCEVTPYAAQIDDCADRIDAVDNYARSISDVYRRERGGALTILEEMHGGYAQSACDGFPHRARSRRELAERMATLAAEAERLRDTIVEDCRRPRLLRNNELPRQLVAVIVEAHGWYHTHIVDTTWAQAENRALYERVHAEAEARFGDLEGNRKAAEHEIRAESAARVRTLIQDVEEAFQRVLSLRDLELLDAMASLSLNNAARAGSESCDFLMLGWLSFEFPLNLHSEEAKKYEGLCDLHDAFLRTYSKRLDHGLLLVPLLMDRSENCSIVISGTRPYTLSLVASLAYRELACTRAGLQRFVIIDYSGRTRGVEQVLPFVEECPELMETPIIVDRAAAIQALTRLADEAVHASQGTLLDVIEATDGTGAHRPLLTVIVLDAPTFTDDALADVLADLAAHGAAIGVNLFVSSEPATEDELQRGNSRGRYLLHEFSSDIVTIDAEQGGFFAWGPQLYPEAPDWTVLPKLRAGIRAAAEAQERVFYGLDGLVPQAARGTGDASHVLSIPFGVRPDGSPQRLEFGDAVANGLSHFALVTGTTGTGKSSLLHAIILSALAVYSPEELELYLLDFKQGVEFEIYRNYRIPHVRVVALDADQAFGVSVLEHLAAELARRAQVYQDLGVTNYAAARATGERNLPRVLVVADEFQVLLNEATDRRAAGRAATILRTFFQTARAFGMHFILTTQALSSLAAGCSMTLADFSQVNVRIGLNNSEGEHRRLFGDAAYGVARELIGTSKGSGAYLADKDAVEPDVQAFRFVYCDSTERNRVLSDVAERYAGWYVGTPIVYRGMDVPALSTSPSFVEGGNTGVPRIHLGAPARMAEAAALVLTPQRPTGLLAVSTDSAMADRIRASYIAGAVWNEYGRSHGSSASGNDTPAVYLFDAQLMMDESLAPSTSAVCRWAGALVKRARTDAETTAMLHEVASLLERCRAGRGQAGMVHVVVAEPQLSSTLSSFVEGRKLDAQEDAMADGKRFQAASHVVEREASEAANASRQASSLDDLLARIDAMNAARDSSASTAASATRSASREDEKTPDVPVSSSVPAGLLKDLLDNGHRFGINVAVVSSDYLSVKGLRYDLIQHAACRVVHGLSDMQTNTVFQDVSPDIGVNPSALRSNTALLWDGRTMLAFKPYRIDVEELPRLR